MIGADGEGHELLQGHAVLGIDLEELLRHGAEPQPLLHYGRRDEEAGGDLLLAGALVAQRLEGAELVQRMQGDALDVLGQRILLRRDLDCRIAHDAGDRGRLRKALLLHQALEGPVAAAAGRDLEHAGLGALGIEDRPDVEALQEPAPGDVLGQVLDRDAGLQAPDVGLAEHQLVEGNVARGAEGDLLNGLCHEDTPRRTAGRFSRPPIRHGNRRGPLALNTVRGILGAHSSDLKGSQFAAACIRWRDLDDYILSRMTTALHL